MSLGLAPLLNQLKSKYSEQAEGGKFWEFWSDYLEAERVQLEKAKDDPGWSYANRRWGLGGAIDFEVGDAAKDIQQRRSRLLLNLDAGPEEELSGHRASIRFELRDPPTKGWISAVPFGATAKLEEIPLRGQLKVDWVGLRSEYNRRYSALQKLRNGETAMPGLNAILPYGPMATASGKPFTPILRQVEYDPGQKHSIESALAPNTISLIMGPPGTGKTSVIAEITAQVVAQGGRVLIASQSNLAVDNALEKISPVETVFAVRMGNAESVKLNKDLHWDNAAERYRRILLEKSNAALTSERESVLSLKCSYSAAQINDAIDGTVETVKAVRQFQNAKAAYELASSEHLAASQRLSLANSTYATLITNLGLNEPEVATVLRVAPLVEGKGWSVVDLGRNASELRRVWPLNEVVAEAEKALETYRDKFGTMLRVLRTRRALERRIEESELKDRRLREIKSENEHLEWKRQNASGWEWFTSHVFVWKTDTNDLEVEIRLLDRSGAECDLPRTQSKLASVHGELESTFLECQKLAAKIGTVRISSPRYDRTIVEETNDATDRLLGAELWPGCLEDCFKQALVYRSQAQFLSKNDSLQIIESLASAAEIASLQMEGESARSAFIAVEQILAQAAETLSRVDAEMQVLKSKEWCNQLDGIQEHFDLSASLVVRTADETSIRGLGQQLQCVRLQRSERINRLAAVEEALTLYHARLGSAGLDLREAVLEEANVVAATCSGIAGTKEFALNFDYVIVDEAGRATPLDLLMPIIKGKSIVLVGDHRQLPPLVDREVQRQLDDQGELKETLFQKLYDHMNGTRKTQLLFQYRMSETICSLVKSLSYSDLELHTAGLALERRHPFGPRYSDVHWIRCVGTKNRAYAPNGGTSLRNDAEVGAAIEVLETMSEVLSMSNRTSYSIGVISMYRAQVDAFERALPAPLRDHKIMNIEFGTVDAFQGREKDAVIVSLVGSDPKRVAFFQEVRRLNVAISRTRELLVLIGNLEELGRHPRVGAVPNAVFDLNRLLQAAIVNGSASSGVFHA
jgi:ABC-type branched-subunit amino acid transport system ATPase component